MEGITVLSQNKVDTTLGNIIAILCSTVLFMLALFVILYGLKLIKERYKAQGYCFFLFLLPIMGLMTLSLVRFTENESYTKYKVTISEEVKLKEFNEKYEIIDQDGEIYTIVERDK